MNMRNGNDRRTTACTQAGVTRNGHESNESTFSPFERCLRRLDWRRPLSYRGVFTVIIIDANVVIAAVMCAVMLALLQFVTRERPNSD